MKRVVLLPALFIAVCLLMAPVALAAPRAALTPGSRFLADTEASNVGHVFGWLGVAIVALMVAMGFVVSSTRLNLPPRVRKWLRRAHGAIGVLLLVFVVVHLLIIGG